MVETNIEHTTKGVLLYASLFVIGGASFIYGYIEWLHRPMVLMGYVGITVGAIIILALALYSKYGVLFHEWWDGHA